MPCHALMIKQIGLPLRGHPILLITRMIKDRIGLHSVLLPLHRGIIFLYLKQQQQPLLFCTHSLSQKNIKAMKIKK